MNVDDVINIDNEKSILISNLKKYIFNKEKWYVSNII